jgi:hypothetical protein
MTAKEEVRREEDRRAEVEGRRLKAEGDDEGRISAAEYAKRKGLKSLTDKIGVKS